MSDDNISNLFGEDGESFEDDDVSLEDMWNMLNDMDVATAGIHLTVAEGKRLIAKGIAQDPRVVEALQNGTVAVCKGSTNAYVLEELLGSDVEKGKYVLGKTLPATSSKKAGRAFKGSIPEVIFRRGELVQGLTLEDALDDMQTGDVVLKGANALDYTNGLAGLLVGHPTGGTMGKIIGTVFGKGLELIVPVGLEKAVAQPLEASGRIFGPARLGMSGIPRLWVFQGSLFTEIEALWGLADVDAVHVASGGLCGAEGAIWLMIHGMDEDVSRALQYVKEVQGEPTFWDAVMGG